MNIFFGTKLVDTEHLKYTSHARKRMRERGFSPDGIEKDITQGDAFFNSKAKRLVVANDRKHDGLGPDDTIAIIEKGKRADKVITVFGPDSYDWSEESGGLRNYRTHNFYPRMPEPKGK